jgi:hypothetical protein
MKSRLLVSEHQKLTWLIAQAGTIGAEQLEMQAHWARYICVVASGFIENALKEVYSSYARSCSSAAVADFVETRLANIQNPKAGRFLETAGAFNKARAVDLEAFLQVDGRKEAIDSIMSNTNSGRFLQGAFLVRRRGHQ